MVYKWQVLDRFYSNSTVSYVSLLRPVLEHFSFLAIFGDQSFDKINNFLFEELLNSILDSDTPLFNRLAISSSKSAKLNEETIDKLKNATRKGFIDVEKKLWKIQQIGTSQELLYFKVIACIITPTHVFIANCGDSKGILVANNEIILATDQTVYETKTENSRKTSLEIFLYVHERSNENDEYLAMANANVWELMNEEELKEFVNHFVKLHSLNDLGKDILTECFNCV